MCFGLLPFQRKTLETLPGFFLKSALFNFHLFSARSCTTAVKVALIWQPLHLKYQIPTLIVREGYSPKIKLYYHHHPNPFAITIVEIDLLLFFIVVALLVVLLILVRKHLDSEWLGVIFSSAGCLQLKDSSLVSSLIFMILFDLEILHC